MTNTLSFADGRSCDICRLMATKNLLCSQFEAVQKEKIPENPELAGFPGRFRTNFCGSAMPLIAFGAVFLIVCTLRSSAHKALDMVMKFLFHWQKSLIF